jgi:hypothetical protein
MGVYGKRVLPAGYAERVVAAPKKKQRQQFLDLMLKYCCADLGWTRKAVGVTIRPTEPYTPISGDYGTKYAMQIPKQNGGRSLKQVIK